MPTFRKYSKKPIPRKKYEKGSDYASLSEKENQTKAASMDYKDHIDGA